jgi:hypothetical protein
LKLADLTADVLTADVRLADVRQRPDPDPDRATVTGPTD